MAYTDTKVNNMIFNILDKDQYSALRTGGQLDSNQFYFITDDDQALLTVRFNGASSGQGFFTYDGSNPVSINITPAAINAVAKGGDTLTGTYIIDRNNGSNSGQIQFKYNDNSSAIFSMSGYNGTATNNTPRLTFTSSKANTSGGSDYNVIITCITHSSNQYIFSI